MYNSGYWPSYLSSSCSWYRGANQHSSQSFLPSPAAAAPQKPLPRLPNPHPPARILNELPTPVKVDRLSFFLSGCIPSIAELLFSGFTFGFPIHHDGERISSHSKNLMSALHNPEVVDLILKRHFHWAVCQAHLIHLLSLHSECHH